MGEKTIMQIQKSPYKYILRREGVQNNEEFQVMMEELVKKIEKRNQMQ